MCISFHCLQVIGFATSLRVTMTEISYRQVDTYPRFAWVAKYSCQSSSLLVRHGEGVEVAPQGIVEGAWNGRFEDWNIAEATALSGTGLTVSDGGVTFFSSTDRRCPLFSILKNRIRYVSNSPIACMAAAGEAPLEGYPYYAEDLISIFRQGLYCQNGPLRLASNHKLCVHFSTQMTCAGVKLSFRPFDSGESPRDYASYYELLKSTTAALLENAADSGRQLQLNSAASISKGYDSTATAAIAKAAGCRKAYTFYNSKKSDPYEDSGVENAKSIGLDCVQFDRWSYTKADTAIEAEFALMPIASNVPMYAMEDVLRSHVYIVGVSGDIIWGQNGRPEAYSNLSETWADIISGGTLIDYRLRVGFTVFSPIFIGAQHNTAIAGIIRSKEMDPWRLSNDYDRPIPRRIAEEAGVPRENFGVRKSGSGHAHLRNVKSFTRAGSESYERFYQERVYRKRSLCFWLSRLRYGALHFLRYRILPNKMRFVPSSYWQRRFPYILNVQLHDFDWKFSFTFQWSFSELKERYKP